MVRLSDTHTHTHTRTHMHIRLKFKDIWYQLQTVQTGACLLCNRRTAQDMCPGKHPCSLHWLIGTAIHICCSYTPALCVRTVAFTLLVGLYCSKPSPPLHCPGSRSHSRAHCKCVSVAMCVFVATRFPTQATTDVLPGPQPRPRSRLHRQRVTRVLTARDKYNWQLQAAQVGSHTHTHTHTSTQGASSCRGTHEYACTRMHAERPAAFA